MAKVNLEDNYNWGTSGTGVPAGVISSGYYVMTHDGTSWSTSGFGKPIYKPISVKEKISIVTDKLKPIKWK
jgi:hypothetical protein